MRQGTTEGDRAWGPRGERHTCRSYMVGSTRYTSCNSQP
jgi:hypothetical protein